MLPLLTFSESRGSGKAQGMLIGSPLSRRELRVDRMLAASDEETRNEGRPEQESTHGNALSHVAMYNIFRPPKRASRRSAGRETLVAMAGMTGSGRFKGANGGFPAVRSDTRASSRGSSWTRLPRPRFRQSISLPRQRGSPIPFAKTKRASSSPFNASNQSICIVAS